MSERKKSSLRIANASGYWGDDPQALERQVRGGQLDYISMDFLAEITMSIMQKQRARDPDAGFARDFLGMLDHVLLEILDKKIKIITNAGGVNPVACSKAIRSLAEKKGRTLKIAIVSGDDILSELGPLKTRGAKFDNMESGDSFFEIENRVEAANIYFGASPVASALKENPDMIITGRVTDTGITLAPMIHEFGWAWNDWDLLASGIVAGHIIECGAQACGGNFTDWKKVKSYDSIGFPIVEMNSDGSFVVTKHPGTGGLVSVDTVREQLVYEMGDPKHYITPDVVADFSSIKLESAGENRVRVYGIKGAEPTPFYKVSMAYRDGYKAQGSILVSGPEARKKAELFSQLFWKRLDLGKYIETATEFAGWNACHRSLGHQDDAAEIVLRLGARAKEEKALKEFAKQIPPLILSGPAGVAVLGGNPKAQEVVSYWPALMPKELVVPKVSVLMSQGEPQVVASLEPKTGTFSSDPYPSQKAERADSNMKSLLNLGTASGQRVQLRELCLARSGDKGDTSNIGVLARSPKIYEFLKSRLTAQWVKNHFQELCDGNVIRYEVPNLLAFNFLLEQALGGGGTMTLRADAQGKTFAQALLRQFIDVPAEIHAEIKNMQETAS